MRLPSAQIVILVAMTIALFTSCTGDKKNPADSGTGASPATPTALVASAKSGARIELSWKDNSSDEKLFRIECKEAGGKYSEIATVPENTVMYLSTELKMNTEYSFRVRANNASGNSGYSNEIAAKTIDVPAAPSNLIATMISSSTADITWDDNSGDEQGFRVERREGTGPYSIVGAVASNVKSITATGLQLEKEYTFRACAYNVAGNSGYSNEIVVKRINVPAAPSNLIASTISSSSIEISWNDNSDDEQGFRIERGEGNGSYRVAGSVASNEKRYSVTGLLSEKEYFFRVRSYNLAMNSEYSNEASAKTNRFPAPSGLAASAGSASQINLTWKDNSPDEQGFRIEVKQGGGTWNEIGAAPANVTVYQATGLSADTGYTFRVRAYNGNEYSAYSEEKTALTPIVVQGIIFAPIPAGSFSMGSSSGESNELPVHTVELPAFEMSVCEITQGQYKAVTGSNPSNFTGDSNLPVEQVTWWDAINFCNALSLKSGLQPCYDVSLFACNFSKNGFRLPTEAEWEYACRAGSTTNYSPGDTESDLARAGWYDSNSGNKTHAVGQKTVNAWGLYDMHGNVFEWCNDWYGSYPAGSAIDPAGPSSGSFRVVRGGNWSYDKNFCWSSYRYKSYPNNKGYITGFRVVRRAAHR